MALNYCWSDDYDEKIVFYRNSPTEDLIDLVRHGGFVDDIPIALRELAERDPVKAIESAKHLLENDECDWILQARVAEFVAEHDKEYVTELLNRDDKILETYVALNRVS